MREREWSGNTERGRTLGQVKDPRVWNRDEYRRLESESFSIFVDNLPLDISKRELFQLFNWTGRINDIYLSRKQKNGGVYIFAFIRYTTKGGALKAIAEMNHTRLRGKVVFVGEAKYRRSPEVKDTSRIHPRGGYRHTIDRQATEEGGEVKENTNAPKKVLMKDNTVRDPHGNGWTKKVDAMVVKENLDWLQKSLVGGSTKAIDFKALRKSIATTFPHIIQVREMGAYKALLTFDNLLNAEEAYTFNMNGLLQFFHSVWRWDESEKSETRRVWLECFGVPLHAWSGDTFRLIGSQWGEVVGCDRATESCSSFSSGRVEIDTCIMDVIKEWVHVTIDTSGFDILVKEIGGEIYGGSDREGTMREGEDSIEQQMNLTTKLRDGVDIMVPRSMNSTGSIDQAAEVTTKVMREEVEDEGRLVISESILNEWCYDNLKHNHSKLVTYHGNKISNKRTAALVGYDEIDSEMTVPWDYGLKENGPCRKEQKGIEAVCLRKPIYTHGGCNCGLGLKGIWAEGRKGLGEVDVHIGLEQEPSDRVGTGSNRLSSGWQTRGRMRSLPPGNEVAAHEVFQQAGDTMPTADALRPCSIEKQGVPAGSGGSRQHSCSVGDAGGDNTVGRKRREGGREGLGCARTSVVMKTHSKGGERLMDDMVLSVWPGGDYEGRLNIDAMGKGGGRLVVHGGGSGGSLAGLEAEDNPEQGDDVVRNSEEDDVPGETKPGKTPDDGRNSTEPNDEAGYEGDEGGLEDVVQAVEDEASDNEGLTLEEQLLENKRTWDLAKESGAMLYDEEDDIMAILQQQNEEIALKKKLAKQRAKSR
ncbi:hypothetical protein AHAS_Ahas07G0080800 [Arachis hypogaea]